MQGETEEIKLSTVWLRSVRKKTRYLSAGTRRNLLRSLAAFSPLRDALMTKQN